MKPATITIEMQCTDCRGNGMHLYDIYDHRGEHVQHEFPCETCHGTGLKDKKDTLSDVL